MRHVVDLDDVTCPICDDETVVLAPEGTQVFDTGPSVDEEVAADADAVVRTTCDEGHEFVVYLREA